MNSNPYFSGMLFAIILFATILQQQVNNLFANKIMNLGQKLHNAIKESGISLPDVAKHIGISEGNLYKIIKKDSFEVAYLLKAASLLNKNISYFIVEEAPLNVNSSQNGSNDVSSPSPAAIQQMMSNTQTPKRAVASTTTLDLADRLTKCQQMRIALERELEIMRELVMSKDEIISLLRCYTENQA